MSLARSSYYEKPAGEAHDEAIIIEKIGEICAELPRYGYRRVTAQLRRDGMIVNHKKVMRIMKEQDLTVRPRRRYVVTTDSNMLARSFRTWRKLSCRRRQTSCGWRISPTSPSPKASPIWP